MDIMEPVEYSGIFFNYALPRHQTFAGILCLARFSAHYSWKTMCTREPKQDTENTFTMPKTEVAAGKFFTYYELASSTTKNILITVLIKCNFHNLAVMIVFQITW